MSLTLTLDPVLDLNAAAPLRAMLLERRGEALSLDASNVQRLGGLCLQVLIAASHTWAHDGKSLAITARSEACDSALRLFGASARFDDSSAYGGDH